MKKLFCFGDFKLESITFTQFYSEKSKKIHSVFSNLSYKNVLLIDDAFDLIDLIEILKAHANNKLDKTKIVECSNFEAKLKKNEFNEMLLEIHFGKNDVLLEFDKIKASLLSAKLSKIFASQEIYWKE